MNHEIMFGVPLFRYHLDPTEIRKTIEERYRLNKNLPMDQTPGGWDCDLKTDFNNSAANAYSDYYDDVMKQFSIDVGLEDGYANIWESWMNCYSGGMNQEEHDHIPSFYSGIHFIKFNPEVHESVYLINPLFSYYNLSYSCAAACRRSDDALHAHDFSEQFRLPDVVEGDIILFPSWLRHRVQKTTTEETRITVAFNINTIQGSARRVFA